MSGIVIVGGGIIGTTLAKSLHDRGLGCKLIDSGIPTAGTRPSGGHLKPSWFGQVPKPEWEEALNLLSETWGLIEEQFTVWPTKKKDTIFRVDTDKVLDYERIEDHVLGFKGINSNKPVVMLLSGEELECDRLFITAGVWCEQLLPNRFPPGIMKRKMGMSFRVTGKLRYPVVKPWAPYKQVVAHQQSKNEIWLGDGSAIVEKNWNELREEKCFETCKTNTRGLIKIKKARRLRGVRPYVKHDLKSPCLLEKLGRKVWVATGSGKSGTLSAGWAASRLLRVI